MRYSKYHALGNDYIVIDPRDVAEISPAQVERICHRHFGAGSDGILYGPTFKDDEIHLKIYNPDGGEAEKSGNGLRIFSRYLYDNGDVKDGEFSVMTEGGRVLCTVEENGAQVSVEMGKVSFTAADIPVAGVEGEVLEQPINIDGLEGTYSAATVGNPHCVILRDKVTVEETMKWGSTLENDPRFPNRSNVQFVEVIDRNNIKIEIWERGAGYTLASGSSSSACAAICKRLGHCDSEITVHMPGGELEIVVSDDFEIFMRGAVTRVAEGKIFPEVFEWGT